jgi:hypothetical protein
VYWIFKLAGFPARYGTVPDNEIGRISGQMVFAAIIIHNFAMKKMFFRIFGDIQMLSLKSGHIGTGIWYPACRFAGYPAKSVSGAYRYLPTGIISISNLSNVFKKVPNNGNFFGIVFSTTIN